MSVHWPPPEVVQKVCWGVCWPNGVRIVAKLTLNGFTTLILCTVQVMESMELKNVKLSTL